MENTENLIFGRVNADGNIDVLHSEDGMAVTRLDENVYPINSELIARYEHAEGIVLNVSDAEKIGLEIE